MLIGVGGTELSYRALEETLDRAEEADDALTVGVFESEEAEPSREAIEATVRERLAAAGHDGDVHHLEGDPGPALADLADGEGYDRIVLGSGKRSTLGKIQLGSVAEFVLLNAHTPVTLIR